MKAVPKESVLENAGDETEPDDDEDEDEGEGVRR